MGIYTTKYKNENGKTRKVKDQKSNNGAPDPKAGAGNNPPAGNPAK
ncbi:MAG: hypothetical protein FWD40_11905 [Treponema sp.]|nr:hypothetical protein [Treponema sp.]